MPTFESIAHEARQRKPAELPLPGSRFNPKESKWEGPVVPLDVIALDETEHMAALAAARETARKHGIEDPKPDIEIYDHAVMVEIIARACVDRDDRENEKPFFPGGAAQIYGSRLMTPEVVAYLYEIQRLHQDEVNPLVAEMSPIEYMRALATTAGGDPSFFVSSRLALRWSFMRSTASQLLAFLAHASGSGGSSEPQPTPPNG